MRAWQVSALAILSMSSTMALAQEHRVLKALPYDESEQKNQAPVQYQSKYFFIIKPEWDDQDEQEFSDFVVKIGNSNCKSLYECLKSSANPYRDSDPPDLDAHSDCADLPMMLRAYFAWKRGLPFSIATAVHSNDPAPPPGEKADSRYSVHGNRIAARKDFVAEPVVDATGAVQGSRHQTIDAVWDMIANQVDTAIYRTDPRQEDLKNFSDFYSPKLDRSTIKPGTVLYYAGGHVAIVYHVADNGDVLCMQAGVDQSVSRIPFNKSSFPQSRTEQGAGFKNWRPQVLVGATPNQYGIHLGGSIKAKTDAELRHEGKLSLEQYRHQDFRYDYNGEKLDWDDYVAARLSGKKWVRDPVRDFNKRLVALCSMIKTRVNFVAGASERGLCRMPHPERLPKNIFGTSEPDEQEWETFSSPGRDADLRSMMADLVGFSTEMLAMTPAELAKTSYSGSDLKADLNREFARQSADCKIEYQNSKGRMVPLQLGDVIARADRISFDPYHCPERRWGASGAELKSCVEDATSTEWYDAQAPLRTQRSRDTRPVYGFTLEEARTALKSLGLEKTKFDLASIL